MGEGRSFHEVAEEFRLWAINAHDQLEEQYAFFDMGWGGWDDAQISEDLATAGDPVEGESEGASRMVDFFAGYAELMGQVAESDVRLQQRLKENSDQLSALYQ